MLRRFRPRRPPTVGGGRRIYAVGDIHGRADLLDALYLLIAADLDRHPPSGDVQLIHLGDYVDRGPDSQAVLERLSLPAPHGVDSVVNLMGNHEELMLGFLEDPAVGRAWLQLGGDTTLAAYGVSLTPNSSPGERFETLRRALSGALPPSHHNLLRGLALYHRVEDYLFVHAGLRPHRALERQRREDLLWIREPFISSRADHGAVVVHGHQMSAAPEERANRIGIDTGAYHSGVLTALVLDGEERRFLATGAA